MDFGEWKRQREEGEEAQLPSGLTVRLRKAGLMDLVGRGDIPQTLHPQVAEWISGKSPDLDGFQGLVEIATLVAQACVLSPVEVREDVMLLPVEDRMAIFQWANEEGASLKTFRGKQTRAVEFASDGEHVRAETEHGAGAGGEFVVGISTRPGDAPAGAVDRGQAGGAG